MASIRDLIIRPKLLDTLRGDIPPVHCMIWKGGKRYESIIFDNIYPFDTIDTIKRMLCAKDSSLIPRFTFIGVPINDSYSDQPPDLDETYVPINYLWYPSGTNDITKTFLLNHPLKTVAEGDSRFFANGNYTSPNYEVRGRSSIEQVFLKPREGQIPTFHVFSLDLLLEQYIGQKPVAEDEWYKRFAPYFPEVKVKGPFRPDDEDKVFAKKIKSYISKREKTLDYINSDLINTSLPVLNVTGVRQLLLLWKKPIRGFEGSATLFYEVPATKKLPYLRLYPAEGDPITKLYVQGILPIPALEDPRILESWGKEVSPTPGMDFCSMKYVHRPSIGITQPIYGTIQAYNDGTMKLMLQPPKQIRKLDPEIDFRHFDQTINGIFEVLPQKIENYQLKELAVFFSMKIELSAKKFTKKRIQQRLGYFHTMFKEIIPLPGDTPLIALRYKAVSQYASEDKVFTFITQMINEKGKEIGIEIIEAIQEEFDYNQEEAKNILKQWHEKEGEFTVQIPEEGEFMESFNPGIDIYVHAQHPMYHFHVHRIDSIETYERIYTLLSILFLENDDYFESSDTAMVEMEQEMDDESLKSESFEKDTAAASSMHNMEPIITEVDDFDPFAADGEETFPNIAAEAASKKPKKVVEEQRLFEEQKLVDPTSWFINKLQEIDPRLFKFKPATEGDKGYSRSCAANDERQPASLTQDQYDRMREIYAGENIIWIIYPLEGTDEPIQPMRKEETVTMMRYGSDADSIHYYFCPHYFCLSDEIMVREVDFKKEEDRDGKPKPKDSCPFCHGKLITNKKKATPGYTVVKRKDKTGAIQPHSQLDFLKTSSHPEGFALPCCFIKQRTLRISDPQFAHLRDAFQQEEMENLGINQEEDEDDEDVNGVNSLLYQAEEAVEYGVLFHTIHRKYILESNKQPDAGTFAMVTSVFDTFFRQNSGDQLVTRVAINLKLRPNAQGFLRVGTENTIYESLLGVIAPLIYKNSIREVKERILEVMVPRIFVNSHFGNLVLEFYNPADGRAMPATKQELMSWSVKELGVTLTSANTYSLIRLYNAFQRFRRFINDPTKRKDLRHIQPLLAEPGLFTPRGIQLVVLEDNGTDPIIIRCPTFGVSVDRNKKNDFAFISRSLKTIGLTDNQYARYELFLHTSNKPAKGGDAEIHESIVLWKHQSRSIWPLIVQSRIDEYMNQCQSRYRSVYSSQQGVNPMAMLPLSKAVEAAPFRPEGIIKDHYNHIIGVTFRMKAGSPYLVILPVVDDGIISISVAFSVKNIYLDWEDIKKAPFEEVIRYYKENLEPVFSLYPGYRIQHAVRQRLNGAIIAVQLENGIYVPVAEPKQELAADISIVEIDELEWELNKQLTGTMPPKKSDQWEETLDQMSIEKQCGMDEELIRISSDKELGEWYEQFRLMVSNWITSQKAGSSIRKGIEEIIFRSDLPEYERRKRLYIFISSTFLSWFYPDPDNWERGTASLLRKDCRLIDEKDSCTGSCHWKEDEGKCLLHVTEKAKVGDRMVSTPELFTKRIIDELVRFPARRKQLMTKGEVSKISKIIQPVRDGDQYIIPEASTTWTNLLRLDWTRQVLEEKKYYEEMSREEDKDDAIIPRGEMPALLADLLGEDTPFRVNIPEDGTLMPFTGILGITLDQLEVEEDAKSLTKDQLINYVRIMTKPIGIIDFSKDQIVQFVRPATGNFDEVTILVFLPDQIGILVERDGDSTVSIKSLPASLQQRWEEAGIVTVKRRKVKMAEEPAVPLIIGQNPLLQQPVIPLVAQKGKEASLVVAPIREKIEEIKAPRKKRIVKMREDQPEKAANPAAKPRRKVRMAAQASQAAQAEQEVD